MRDVTGIVIHCSATPEGRDVSANEIRKWHIDKGWRDIGYHYVARLDGTIEPGRPEDQDGAHVQGHNRDTIGICYVGGVDRNGVPKDTRTPGQKLSLRYLVEWLKLKYPTVVLVCGHRDFPGVNKACPSFDVATEL